MGWLTSDERCASMLRACAEKGWAVDAWWRDESRLAAWWGAHGVSTDAATGWAAIPAGAGYVAWIGYCGNAVYRLDGIAPDTGQAWWAREKEPRKWPADWITPFNCHKIDPTPRGDLPAIGDRMAAGAVKRGYIGIAETIGPSGAVELIRTDKKGTIVAARNLAHRWFVVSARDQAFDWFWERGETVFSGYHAMVSKLYWKQKKLTGAALQGGVDVPKGREGPPNLTVHAVDKSITVATLAGARDAAEAAWWAHRDTYIAALNRNVDNPDPAIVAQEKALEKAMGDTWDAWDAAARAWNDELLE